MHVTHSSKVQTALQAPARRRLKEKAGIEPELEGPNEKRFRGLAKAGTTHEPIRYPAPGSLRVNTRMLALDKLIGSDAGNSKD